MDARIEKLEALVRSINARLCSFKPVSAHSDLTGVTADQHHAQSHSIISNSDHTSTATSGQMLKANANGLPVDATNTDVAVAAAVTASHARSHTYDSTDDHSSTLSTTNLASDVWHTIAETVVAGAAVTSVSFTGLDLETDKAYKILIFADNNNASDADIYLYCNNDTTAGHYYSEYFYASGNSVGCVKLNTARVGYMDPSDPLTAEITVQKISGNPTMATSIACRNDPAAVIFIMFGYAWNDTTNVTRLDVTSLTANAFAIGSRFTLQRMRK